MQDRDIWVWCCFLRILDNSPAGNSDRISREPNEFVFPWRNLCPRAPKVGRDGICYTRGTNTNWCHSLCRLAPGPRPHRDTEKGRRWLFCRAFDLVAIMESARTMSSSSSRYVENMAHVQAGEVHVNCPSIMTVSSGKGHTTTLTPTMCRLSLACGTATMVVVARPLCLLDMRGTSIDKSSNAVVRA